MLKPPTSVFFSGGQGPEKGEIQPNGKSIEKG